jgi:hypothetical protein
MAKPKASSKVVRAKQQAKHSLASVRSKEQEVSERATSRRPTLKEQHPSEYYSWKAMKARAAKGLCVVHRKFASFEQFIEILGPKDDSSYTLDRIDSADREYAPGKVRWASKSLQARNRSNTVWLVYSGKKYPAHAGKTLSLTEWAAVTTQSASTMRRRRIHGWSDDENIEGNRARAPKTFEQMSIPELLEFRPWDEEKADAQEAYYLDASKKHENRFEFMLSAIQSHHFQALRERHRSTAYYMNDEQERDAYEARFGGFDEVVGAWGKKPNATQRDWEQLLADDAAHREKYAGLSKRYTAWRKAITLANAARARSDNANRRQQELSKRYGTPRRPRASARFEDDDD